MRAHTKPILMEGQKWELTKMITSIKSKLNNKKRILNFISLREFYFDHLSMNKIHFISIALSLPDIHLSKYVRLSKGWREYKIPFLQYFPLWFQWLFCIKMKIETCLGEACYKSYFLLLCPAHDIYRKSRGNVLAHKQAQLITMHS